LVLDPGFNVSGPVADVDTAAKPERARELANIPLPIERRLGEAEQLGDLGKGQESLGHLDPSSEGKCSASLRSALR
jgi:hypothetical protein